jgi:hypothetical protein
MSRLVFLKGRALMVVCVAYKDYTVASREHDLLPNCDGTARLHKEIKTGVTLLASLWS